MNAERIMDAMNLLPDELLEKTNILRNQKRAPWKPVLALAACLCLVVGLWLLFPGAKSADNAAEGGAAIEEDLQFSVETDDEGYSVYTVIEVAQDHITVVPGRQESLCDSTPLRVSLELLDQIPKMAPGQFLRLYLTEEKTSGKTEILPVLIPYKIEIEEE